MGASICFIYGGRGVTKGSTVADRFILAASTLIQGDLQMLMEKL